MPLSKDVFTGIYNQTAKKLYNMLASVFRSSDEAVDILNETFSAIASSEQADESAVYKTAATLSVKKLGVPAPTNYEKNVLDSFFATCEQFDARVSQEAIDASDALLAYFEPVDSFNLLVLYLRMYCEMSIVDIAQIIGTNENTAKCILVDSYRSFMTTAAATVKEDTLLNQFPLLQLFHIALLNQKQAVHSDNTYNEFFDYTFNQLIAKDISSTVENLFFLNADRITPNEPEEIAEELPAEEEIAEEIPAEEEIAEEIPAEEEIAEEIPAEEEITEEIPAEEEIAEEIPAEEEIAEEIPAEEEIAEEISDVDEDEAAEELLYDDDDEDAEEAEMEDIYSGNSDNNTPVVEPAASNPASTKFSFNDSPEWSRLKSIFRFSVNHENNMKLSRAFELILDGQFAPAQNIINSIKNSCNNAAVYLGLLMIDVRARSIDELLFVRTNFREMPNFIAADDLADVELKDFLSRIAKKADAAMAAAPAPEAEDKPAKKEKKKSGSTVALIVTGIIILIVAVAAVVFFGFNEYLPISKEETVTTEAPVLPVMTKTASYKVRLQDGISTQIEFRPLQSGYYGFRSKENTADVAIKLLDKNGNVIDEDRDSVGETEFLAFAQCDSNSSIIISIYSENAAPTQDQISFSVYSMTDAEAEAVKKYREYSRNGVTLTDEDKLHIIHDKASQAYRYPTGAKALPVDFYIDGANNTLWLAFKARVSGSSATLWYPVELKAEAETTAEATTKKAEATTKKAEATTKKAETTTKATTTAKPESTSKAAQ